MVQAISELIIVGHEEFMKTTKITIPTLKASQIIQFSVPGERKKDTNKQVNDIPLLTINF